MHLPIQPPFAPMEALLVDEIPLGDQWQYEPKWDGFRCLVIRDGSEVQLQSKSGQGLSRYFPELIEAFLQLTCQRFVIDGEIAVPVDSRFSFDDLLQRIHPAASRVQKLSREHPALFIAFDMLVTEAGKSVVDRPLEERRASLEQFAKKCLKRDNSLRLSPATTELSKAKQWFKTVGGDLDGIVAKRTDLPINPVSVRECKKSNNSARLIASLEASAMPQTPKWVGSLLLGLYNEQNLLDHVGFCSGLSTEERKALKTTLEPLIEPPGFTGHAPGGFSRWSTKRSMEWEPLRPNLVIEVSYDHFTGGRFRHGTRLIRWRPDKAPTQCRLDQVTKSKPASLKLL